MSAQAEPSTARVSGIDALTQAAILDQLAEGVIVTSADGRITLVNAAAERLHGVARLDVEPDGYSETFHLYTEDGLPFPSLDLPLARAVRGEVVSEARWRIRRPDGTEIVAIGDARPLRNGAGHQIGAVLTLRDDTARDAADRALRDLNDSLAETVTARTRDAETAQRVAEQANTAKSDFLASVSHELRTPLHSVLGYAELIARDLPADGSAAEMAKRIRHAGGALLGLVNDLLDLSRIEAGRLNIIPEPFNLRDLADDSLAMVRESALAKGLRLELDVSALDEAEVIGDAFRIGQVLINLLSNAVKFTAAGEVTLRVTQPAPGRTHFAITDTGVGVAPDKRRLLFQRFSQVDGTQRREHTGAGLGLAISKRLVERLSGSIGMSSSEGVGSTFWVELPLPGARGRMHAEPSVRCASEARRRVLLVDDVAVNQDLGRMMLESAGHLVDVASGGEEAVEAVSTTDYDVVFMDVHMPKMDGLTATKLIRTLSGAPSQVPIVALTADALPQSVEAALAAGMNDHLGKPFTCDALLASVLKMTVPGKDSASLVQHQ